MACHGCRPQTAKSLLILNKPSLLKKYLVVYSFHVNNDITNKGKKSHDYLNRHRKLLKIHYPFMIKTLNELGI